jgi:alkanesulfonate monooxygenase SsuD/methylene tetrahydromethanopterin reductase-like flavin-dependent oxidoreductase (luciferase family)
MKFGFAFPTHISGWDLISYAEELGYDNAWVPDSQMIWSDCYATMSLAALNTKRIRIGTGVAIAGTRIAPVTAHSIASINQLAPRRTFLGIGTGHTAMRVMGQDPMPVGEFREYLKVVRALLDGKEVDYTYRGKTRQIAFLHRDRRFVNVDDRVPMYVAATLPKALRSAGAYGDGWMTTTLDPAGYAAAMEEVRAGAKEVGRALASDFHTACITSICVLRSGDKLTDERVISETGPMVTTTLHFTWENWRKHGRKDELIPPFFASIWDDYTRRAESYSLPEKARFRQIHDGHATFLQPGERRFVTPETIAATCVVGQPDEIASRVRELEKMGVKEVVLLPAMDWQRKVLRDVSETVLPLCSEGR